MTNPEPVHGESETHGWGINVPNHPTRADSPEYVAARNKMNELAGQATGMIYGQGPYQDHHGGALWLKDSQGWFVVRNQAGIEWSSQFCAEPAKVDLLRQNAQRLYNLVSPEIKQQLDPGGLLDTPITDAAGVAKWTDSIFNAGVPLHPTFHTGVLPAGGGQSPPAPESAQPAGVHHYPTPIVDIQLFKYDDFQLWVTDDQGNPAAVAPVDKRGSGNASVHVLYATPGSRLAQQKHETESAGNPLILGPDHSLSQQAYQNQQAPDSGGTPGSGGASGSGGAPGT
jgi:Family of unknown function (DUF6424)